MSFQCWLLIVIQNNCIQLIRPRKLIVLKKLFNIKFKKKTLIMLLVNNYFICKDLI